MFIAALLTIPTHPPRPKKGGNNPSVSQQTHKMCCTGARNRKEGRVMASWTRVHFWVIKMFRHGTTQSQWLNKTVNVLKGISGQFYFL